MSVDMKWQKFIVFSISHDDGYAYEAKQLKHFPYLCVESSEYYSRYGS